MNETKEFETLPALAEVVEQRERARKQPTIASVRVSPGPYLTVAAVLTFFAALLLRVQYDGWALLLVAAAWLILPLLAFTDRIVFDGLSLRRQGPIDRKSTRLNSSHLVISYAVFCLKTIH